MGKARAIIRILRRQRFLVEFWGTFFALISLPKAFTVVAGWNISARNFISLVIFSFIFSIIWHRNKLKKLQLPPEADFITGETAIIHCPCEMSLADRAKQLALDSYPKDLSITPDVFESLRAKNPLILACLTTTSGELLGYFDVIPLRESFAQQLLEGKVTETQINHEQILTEKEMGSCNYLFISGLAVSDPDTQSGRLSAQILTWALIKYVEKFYYRTDALIFALASTKAGEALLKKFKFLLGCDASARLDKYRLYQLKLSPTMIDERKACLPDWSDLCTLSWISVKKPAQRIFATKRRPTQAKSKTYMLSRDPSKKVYKSD